MKYIWWEGIRGKTHKSNNNRKHFRCRFAYMQQIFMFMEKNSFIDGFPWWFIAIAFRVSGLESRLSSGFFSFVSLKYVHRQMECENEFIAFSCFNFAYVLNTLQSRLCDFISLFFLLSSVEMWNTTNILQHILCCFRKQNKNHKKANFTIASALSTEFYGFFYER